MVAEGQPEDRGRRDQVAVTAVGAVVGAVLVRGRARPRRPAATAGSPRTPGGACASRHAWPIAQAVGVSASPMPGRHSERQEARSARRTRSTVTPAATATQIVDSRFIRKAGSPNGWRSDRRQPAEQHVGREAGRVGGAHQRARPPGARPVSQNATPGSSVSDAGDEGDRARPTARRPAAVGSPRQQPAPHDAPQVDRERQRR